MKTFNSVASLKLAKIKVGGRVARYYYERGGSGYAEGVVKTAAQATDDGDVIDGVYVIELANGNVWVMDEKQAEKIYDSFATKANPYSQILALAKIGRLRMSLIGDSTITGIGVSNATPYAEANDDYKAGWSSWLYYDLLTSDPNFTKPLLSDKYYRHPNQSDIDTPLSMPFEGLSLEESENPTTGVTRVVKFNRQNDDSNKLTVYHGIQTSPDAARFTVNVTNDAGDLLVSQQIDSYTPSISYVGGEVWEVGNKITATVITLPANRKAVRVYIDNVDSVDRAEGVATGNGFTFVYGYAIGNGSAMQNIGVSSTTLLNESADNISRGVTTTERLQKAYDFNTNVFFINFASNDSKVGVSTPEQFREDLVTRVGEIRAQAPDSVIILMTAPRGDEGSVYEDNVTYYKLVKRTAKELGVGLFTGDEIMETIRADGVADNVHPSALGYMYYRGALSGLIGTSKNGNEIVQNGFTPSNGAGSVIIPSASIVTPITEVFSHVITKPYHYSVLNLSATVNVFNTVDIDDGRVRLKLNGVTVVSQVFSQSLVNGVAKTTITLGRNYTVSGAGNYTVTVEIEKCGITSTNSLSTLNYSWSAD